VVDILKNRSAVVFADYNSAGKIKEGLAESGYHFVTAPDTKIAARKIRMLRPSVILMDYTEDGVTIEQIQALLTSEPLVREMPVIVLHEEGNVRADDFKEFSIVEFISKDETFISNLATRFRNDLKPSVKVKFWGVRGSTPTANPENIRYGGNTTCVTVSAPFLDEYIILDSGSGIRNLGNFFEREMKYPVNGRVFITHPHWDHIQGFPFFKPFYHRENRFSIHMPEQYRGGAKEILAGHLTKTFFPITLDMISADISYITQDLGNCDYEGYSVEFMLANHPTKTAIYKIRIGGYTIVFCPDNELPLKSTPVRFIDRFEKFIDGTDLLIHDAQFCLKNYSSKMNWGHSAWERVIEVAKNCNVKRLYLTHHDPDSDDDYLDQISDEVVQYSDKPFIDVKVAKEGYEISLPIVENEFLVRKINKSD